MAAEKPSLAEQRGKELITHLKTPKKQDITGEVIIGTATGLPKCQYFVTFPEKLSKLFPDSYISPESFIDEILPQNSLEKRSSAMSLIGEDIARSNSEPVFSYGYGIDDNFSINVWNGATNLHARRLSELATHNLKEDEEARAKYQNELYHIVKPNIEGRFLREEKTKGALVYHDDCLASADSIVGHLTNIIQNDPERLAKIKEWGVDVIIDGPATAQGILFLKAFAQLHDFKLRLNVGYMGFGLNEANYITYPEEILKMIDSGIAQELEKLGNKGTIQVVGDMGKAIQKVSDEKMMEMREKINPMFNPLHEWRNDNYQQDNTGAYIVEIPPHSVDKEGEIIYMAKGGFQSIAADRYLNTRGHLTNETVIDAGRMHVDGVYGAAYYALGEKQRDP